MYEQTSNNSQNHNIADMFLMFALGAFLLFKGFITFVLEPLAAGPDLKAYLEPLTEILIAIVAVTCALTRRHSATSFVTFALFAIAITTWITYGHYSIDFAFLVGPELLIFATAILSFTLHRLTARTISGD
jgi:hypothetical protein